ncbi:hypothetical protein V493_01386 [Pseudogymnoascus sp. VKM F-4281 (FW-2241)]|nr:hypothetical protein V493_01386 [Pseudogymnoascus sp. VKM F-4281 (FW-2241)]
MDEERQSALQEAVDQQDTRDGNQHRQVYANICLECQQLDLSSILNAKHGIKVGNRFRTPSGNGCTLCDILRRARSLSEEILLPEQDVLRTAARKFGINDDGNDIFVAFSILSNQALFRRHRNNRLVFDSSPKCLAVLPAYCQGLLPWKAVFHGSRGYPIVLDNENTLEAFIPQAIPRRFVPDSVTNWIKFCSRHHTRLCKAPVERYPNLRLIDCNTLKIVPAPQDAKYVALSWVWGPQSGLDGQARCDRGPDGVLRLPSTLPLLIADSVSVTKALDYQYLWVDKFCIDQSDDDAKREQICHMDSVYECSELTIIAAAGSDGTYGLPGVSARPRKQQQIALAGDFQIIWSMADPYDTIRTSTWYTRGWTFQEAILSRRRLAFTDDQMYFECDAMNCYESLATPLDNMHVQNRSKMLDCMRSGMFGRNEKLQFGKLVKQNLHSNSLFLQYLVFIEEYSGRALTKEEDSLNAFQGIMQYFSRYTVEQGTARFYQVCGIPYLDAPHKSQTEKESYFVDALAWNHVLNSGDRDRGSQRRSGFPSWSWAGWAGKVEYRYRVEKSYAKNPFFQSYVADISLHQDGKQLVFPTWPSEAANPTTTYEGIRLSFKAKRVPWHSYQVNPNVPGEWLIDGSRATLFLSLETRSEAEVCRQLVEGDALVSVPLGGLRGFGYHFIVVLRKNFSDETYSRVGLFILTKLEGLSHGRWQEQFTVERFTIV